MSGILWTIFGFILGALPFSVWVGQIALGKDIRQVGDANPGAANVLRAGGMGWYLLALMLDITKAALPVGLAVHIAGISGGWLIPIALAPPLGHAFSPFLKFRGGKAVAATFGTWIGLTLWKIPLVAVVFLIIFVKMITPQAWAILATLLGVEAALRVWINDPILVQILIWHAILLIFTHRNELQLKPRLRFLKRE